MVKGSTPSNLDEAAFTDVATGTLVNSGFLNGLSVVDAKKKMITWLEENGKGRDKVNYKLRDWVFSRQRYWGEPIPMVHCDKCGWQPLPESSLPLTLPDITDFEPGPDGESPLARHKDWVKTTCPCCGGPATRETDTMPQWAGSSWYFLRYMDPHCKDALASKEALEYWSPVDWYNGGLLAAVLLEQLLLLLSRQVDKAVGVQAKDHAVGGTLLVGLCRGHHTDIVQELVPRKR